MRVAASARFVEESLKNVDHEFHRRVVVVENQHAIHGRLLGLRLRLGDDGRARADNLVSLMLLRHDGSPTAGGERCSPATIRYENLGPLEGLNCDLRSFNAISSVWWRQRRRVLPMTTTSAPNRPRSAVDRLLAGERTRFAAIEEVAAGARRFDDVGDADADQPPGLTARLGDQHLPRCSEKRASRLGGEGQGAAAGDDAKVGLPQLQCDDAAGDRLAARAAGDLLAQRPEHVLQLGDVAEVRIEGGLGRHRSCGARAD